MRPDSRRKGVWCPFGERRKTALDQKYYRPDDVIVAPEWFQRVYAGDEDGDLLRKDQSRTAKKC